MNKPPASLGRLWIKQGFTLFRKQPAELSTLFISYMFLMLALNFIPLIGQFLPLILTPTFSIAFLEACAQAEQGKRVYPNLLLTGFRSPALRRLIMLGALYLLAAVLAIAASSLIDGGVFWKVMGGQLALDAKEVQASKMPLAMLFAAAVYIPAAMAFWYAAPLMAWKNMNLPKALFYSFFTVKSAGKAFLTYGFAWIIVGGVLPAIGSTIIALIFGKVLAVFILMPVSIVMSIVMYCSFYLSYVEFFDRPYASTIEDSKSETR